MTWKYRLFEFLDSHLYAFDLVFSFLVVKTLRSYREFSIFAEKIDTWFLSDDISISINFYSN